MSMGAPGGQASTIPFMIELTADEARVLGVLIEKAFTTPEQYPLTLNAVVNGANQKNNRDPVITMDEGRAFDALESLRAKKLVFRADMAGSRVNKFRHQTGDALHARPAEVAILAELLLRGPQTLGELRGRASRMQPFESVEAVRDMLNALMLRQEPLVRELAPTPGSRAEKYAQLLFPELPRSEETGSSPPVLGEESAVALKSRVELLEKDVADLRGALQRLALAIGEPDPLAAPNDDRRKETQIV